MSSPARPFAQTATTGREGNARKRLFADSDSEQREAKKPKPQNEDELRRDTKEKKKRRKKKRKLSVVQPQPHDPKNAEEHVAPVASQSRSRSRSVTLAGCSSISPEPHLKQNAPPCACASTSAMASREPSPSHSSSSKGKGRATDEDMAPQASQQEITALKDQVSAKATLVSQHEDLLSTFQQSLSCQICLDLMHRPFALAPCGHSACYQCLLNWFKAAPPDVPANELLPVWLRKKTCPHCRAVVKERPIEIWTIKEMVASLVKSGLAVSLLPAPEQAVDPAAADPWSGIFRPSANQLHGVFPDGQPPALLQQVMGLRDDEDGGIYRCIDCHHEIWDGACSECGRVYPGHNPEGPHADELDDPDHLDHWDLRGGPIWDDEDDEDDEDYLEEYGAGWAGLDMLRQLFFPPAPHYRHDEDGDSVSDGGGSHHSEDGSARIEEVDREEGGEGGSEDGYESSFIDDGDDGAGRRRLARRRAPSVDLDRDEVIELSDDESEYRPEAPQSEADDVQYVGQGRRRAALAGRARGPIVITSDEDEDDDDYPDPYGARHIVSDDEEDADNLADEVAARER
ncbi:hypothetical protein C8Q70DRAFT_220023 [Cubamyces menziesii]|nr:hypothetical protein C8Q70DRAFT_220023 [Cubamyces menziesii]